MHLLLAIIGLAQGLIISAAIIVFLSILDILPQLCTITGTTKAVRAYSYSICFGIILGAFVQMLPINAIFNAVLGQVAMIAVGLSMGIFTGIFLSALAEVLDVFPIFSQKLKIIKKMPILVASLAMGKTLGSLIYWMTPYFRK